MTDQKFSVKLNIWCHELSENMYGTVLLETKSLS